MSRLFDNGQPLAYRMQQRLVPLSAITPEPVYVQPVSQDFMSDQSGEYAPLDPPSLPHRLVGVPAVSKRLGTEPDNWRVREVGDGNLNLVFIVESDVGSVVVKQALPYVRLVGDSWPLPLSRSFFEYHALTRQAQRAPGTVPEIYHFDETQALIVMEFLSPHHILRHSLQTGEKHQGLGQMLGKFCADTLFKGSDFYLGAATRKHDLALFADNVALCDITESLVFTDPYFDAPMNRHTSPQLDQHATDLRNDIDAKLAAQSLKYIFSSHAQTMLHGDLHTGSVMVNGNDAKVIDPEFALYGPMGFDIGMLIANFVMAWCAQPAYATADDDREAYQAWILDVVRDIWDSFEKRFSELWRKERLGMLYPATLFEDQHHGKASEIAMQQLMQSIWTDTVGFCGVEIIRRILGLAHIEEYEAIEDTDSRAACEATGLLIGRNLMVNRETIGSLDVLLTVVLDQGKTS